MSIIFKELRFIRNAAILALLGFGLSRAGGYLYRIVVSRLGTEAYGSLYLTLSITSVLIMLCGFGMDGTLIRYLPIYQEKRELGKLKRLVIMSTVIPFVFTLIVATCLFLSSKWIGNTFHNQDMVWILRIFSLTLPFEAMSLVFLSGLKSLKLKNESLIIQIAVNRFFLIFITFVLMVWSNKLLSAVLGYAIMVLLSFSLSASIFFLKLNKSSKMLSMSKIISSPILSSIKFSEFKEYFVYSIPLLISGSSYALIRSLNVTGIGYFLGSKGAGFYDLSILTAMLLYIIPQAVIFMFVPVMSGLYAKKNSKKFYLIVSETRKYNLIALIIGILPLLFFSKQLILIFFGPEFAPAAVTIPILALAIFSKSLVYPQSNALIVFGKTKAMLVMSLIAILINGLLLVILIPYFGINGAAIATLIAHIIEAILITIYYNRIRISIFKKEDLA